MSWKWDITTEIGRKLLTQWFMMNKNYLSGQNYFSKEVFLLCVTLSAPLTTHNPTFSNWTSEWWGSSVKHWILYVMLLYNMLEVNIWSFLLYGLFNFFKTLLWNISKMNTRKLKWSFEKIKDISILLVTSNHFHTFQPPKILVTVWVNSFFETMTFNFGLRKELVCWT